MKLICEIRALRWRGRLGVEPFLGRRARIMAEFCARFCQTASQQPVHDRKWMRRGRGRENGILSR